MVTYKGNELTRFKEKSGGKNKSEVDGFYKETEGNQQFFIKKPDDQGELFAELFAGLLLREFMKRELIDEIYFPSLICADVIRFEDGSYGLIQPLISFDELHKVIGTTTRDGSDRSAVAESFWGPSYYTTLTQQGGQFGLSMALMFSLWLGAHSVHSGNMVVLKNTENTTSKQFARLDWGDAFRNFAHLKNNENILYPSENRGWFNYKSITKDYFLNYKNIKGLFPAMAEKAQLLQKQLNEELLIDIVSSALKNIPADLIDQPTKEKFAKYMCMGSFSDVTFGSEGNCKPFAREMAALLAHRLGKISQLQDLTVASHTDNLYESIIGIKPVIMSLGDETSFSELIKHWDSMLSHDKNNSIDNSLLDLPQLAHYFNNYVSLLADQCTAADVWTHDPANPNNLFAPYYKGMGQAEHGHAFVGQYKESTILRRLFSIDPNTLNLSRFAPFEIPCQEYTHAHKDAPWAKIQTLLTLGQGIINTLNVIKKSQDFGLDEVVEEQVKRLKHDLAQFTLAEQEVQFFLRDVQIPPAEEDVFFYPIDDSALNSMTGDQLATICLEELNHSTPTLLIERIIKNDELWHRVDEAFSQNEFNGRTDAPLAKIAKAREWRQLLQITVGQVIELEGKVDQLGKQVKQKTRQLELLINESSKEGETAQLLRKKIKELEQQTLSTQSLKEEIDRLTSELGLLQQKLLAANQKTTSVTSDYIKQISNLNQQISAKEKELALQLRHLEKENERLLSDIKKQNKTKEMAEESVRVLKLELVQLQPEVKDLQQQVLNAREQLMSVSEEQESKLSSLNEQIKAKEQHLAQLTEQVSQLQEENRTLQLEVSKQSSGKLLAENSVRVLEEEVLRLQSRMEDLQKQLLRNEEGNSLLSQKSEEIKLLDMQIRDQKAQLDLLNKNLIQLNAKNQAFELKIEQLEQEKGDFQERIQELQKQFDSLNLHMVQLQQNLSTKEQTITELTHRLKEQTSEKQKLLSQIEHLQEGTLGDQEQISEYQRQVDSLNLHIGTLQQQLSIKEQTIAQLTQKLKEQAAPIGENEARFAEAQQHVVQAQQAQKMLQTEVDSLQRALRQQKSETAHLNQMLEESSKAQHRYEQALKNNKDLYFARMERMAPILMQVHGIEQKANELKQRKEFKASDAANLLARHIREEIKKYAENKEMDEAIALNHFKTKAQSHVTDSKKILGEHRQEWKYILANITLAILLAGVGYAAAALINKQVTGNFTFFSTTKSEQQVEQLEKSITHN